MTHLPQAPAEPGPLWARIDQDLRARLAAGDFADRFPGELDLAEQYGVSRGTIRVALRSLRESGMVSAERGRSQRIVADSGSSSFGPIYSLFEQVTTAGLSQRSVTLTQGACVNPEAAQHLGVNPETRLFQLSRVRFANNVPLAVDHAWLPWDLAHQLLTVDFRSTALYRELRERCGVVLDSGEESLSAELASAELAKALECTTDTVIFRIERTGYRAEAPVEFRRTLIRADRYTVQRHFGTGGPQRNSA